MSLRARDALRVSKIRRHGENVLLLGRGRYLTLLQARINHARTQTCARTHARIHASLEFPPGIPDI